MATSDIEKLAVFDDRIVQPPQKYKVVKGALSVTNAPFAAISESAAAQSFNIYVPSENCFVDRAIEWSSTVYLQGVITYTAAPAAGVPLAVIGNGVALPAFPLNSLCSTQQATINDAVVSINSSDVLKELLRMTDYKQNRLQRTCPTMLDVYQAYADANGTINNPLASYANATDHANVPNGAFPWLEFTLPGGGLLSGNGTYANAAVGGQAVVTYVNGVPVGDGATTVFSVYFKFTSTEKLVLSPFIFADSHECETGLFGINNIQLICNFQSPARLLRFDPTTGAAGVTRSLTGVAFNQNLSKPFENSQLNVQFLTPSIDVKLPAKSAVDWYEAPRYISNLTGNIAAGATQEIASQTVTLPMIPDALMIFVKPRQASGTDGGGNPYPDPTTTAYADGYLPIATRYDGVKSPLRVQFDNFSGLLSSHTTEQLYAMAVRAGLEMDWEQFIGSGQKAGANVAGGTALGGKVALTGGPLVLRPGLDIALQAGQAPGLVGNYTLQLNYTIKNNFSFPVAGQLYIIAINSGYLESIRGSSRLLKGVLSEQDILDAPVVARESDMNRLIGAGFMSKLGHALGKAREIYHATKPMVSAIKEALPAEGRLGQVKGAMGAVGYGMSGGYPTGAGKSGAGKGKKMSLAERLM